MTTTTIDPGTERILRPVRQRRNWPSTPPTSGQHRRIVVVDTETTGLDPDRHQIIEVAAARIVVDADGKIAAVEESGSGLNDPGVPLTAEVKKITGLTDDALAGIDLDRAEVAAFLHSGDAIVAFNASFDRPFLERCLGDELTLPWGCAMRDLDWRDLGFEPGPQGYLLAQAGFYNPRAHRAADDIVSLVELLDHRLGDGETVIAKLLAAIDAPWFRLEARLPYPFRHKLSEQRFRWSARHKVWHKTVPGARLEDELAAYRDHFGSEPRFVRLDASARHRSDRSWEPIAVPSLNI